MNVLIVVSILANAIHRVSIILAIVGRAVLLYGLNNPQPVYQQKSPAVIGYQP